MNALAGDGSGQWRPRVAVEDMGHDIVSFPARIPRLLEAAAAGLPIIASDVGGVPEIFGPLTNHLIPADDLVALVRAIAAAVDHPVEMQSAAQVLKARVLREFSLNNMVECNLAAYREALAERKLAESA